MLFAVMAIGLGTIAVLSYKNYRHQHYEGVASAQLATAVVGASGMLDKAVQTGDKIPRGLHMRKAKEVQNSYMTKCIGDMAIS